MPRNKIKSSHLEYIILFTNGSIMHQPFYSTLYRSRLDILLPLQKEAMAFADPFGITLPTGLGVQLVCNPLVLKPMKTGSLPFLELLLACQLHSRKFLI